MRIPGHLEKRVKPANSSQAIGKPFNIRIRLAVSSNSKEMQIHADPHKVPPVGARAARRNCLVSHWRRSCTASSSELIAHARETNPPNSP
jgi:hypothetical protein